MPYIRFATTIDEGVYVEGLGATYHHLELFYELYRNLWFPHECLTLRCPGTNVRDGHGFILWIYHFTAGSTTSQIYCVHVAHSRLILHAKFKNYVLNFSENQRTYYTPHSTGGCSIPNVQQDKCCRWTAGDSSVRIKSGTRGPATENRNDSRIVVCVEQIVNANYPNLVHIKFASI